VKSQLARWLALMLGWVCVAAASTLDGQTDGRPPAPLLRELSAIAQRHLDRRAAQIAAVQDVRAAAQRQADVRQRILALIGGLPDYRGALNAIVTRTTQRDGFAIDNVMFESLPGYYVTANLYRPNGPGRHPAILMSMGHWESGKAAGQLLSSNLARKGFVVLTYDPVGQGERQQAYDARVGRSLIGGATEQHFLNGAAAILKGQSVARYFVHDGMRAIDYLVSRPEVDPDRIGATGCSGGGTQTTYIAALDERVKVAAVACYMNSFRTLFSGSVGDSEQSIPGFLSAALDQADYVELFAPRPWLIASTTGDFFTPAGARQVYEEARRWYALYNVPDRVKWVVGPGGHGTPLEVREAIYTWMIRWLRAGQGDSREESLTLVPDHDLRVTPNGQVEGRELYQIIADVPVQTSSTAELASVVRDLVSANPPLARSFRILPDEPGGGRRAATVIVQGDLKAGRDTENLLSQGKVVVLVAPSGQGRDASRERSGNWLNNTRAWLVGRNLPAMHAAEINAAVAEAVKRPDVDASRITARASGVLGVALLLAAAVNEEIASVSLEGTPHSLRAAIDRPVHTNLHDAVIPGFALKGDLADLRDLIRPRPVVWKDPTDWMGNVVVLDGSFTYSSSDPNRSR
jgi:hypothetical protein